MNLESRANSGMAAAGPWLAPRAWRRALRRSLAVLCMALCTLAPGAGALAATAASDGPGGQPGPARSAGGDQALAVALDFVVPRHQAGARYHTPATVDTALAADLARRLHRPLATTRAADAAELTITTLHDSRRIPDSMAVIALDYRAAPMAIMRTDSRIRRWEDLRGRKVCLAEGGAHVGDPGDRYGAIERVRPSLTEALLDLRTGECDAMVHDSVLLEELLRLPEWKKFSRRLAGRPRSTLAVVVPGDDARAVSRIRQIARVWQETSFTESLVRTAIRDVAFEVYVEQEVPDCH